MEEKGIKKKVTFNVNIITIKEFDKKTEKMSINKSKLIENLIKEWIILQS